jgi:hypothetical protein
MDPLLSQLLALQSKIEDAISILRAANTPDAEEWLLYAEAAQVMGCSKESVRKMAARGKLPLLPGPRPRVCGKAVRALSAAARAMKRHRTAN